MRDIDHQIKLVQDSTRTTFRAFCPLHNHLRIRSRHYYNWHLKRYSDLVHFVVLTGVSFAGAFFVFNSYARTTAADEVNLPSQPNRQESVKQSSNENQTVFQQLSKLASDETLKIIADKVGPVSTLSSEQTQKEIRDQIETNLAKDSSISSLIAAIRDGDSSDQAVMAQFSVVLSKLATDAALNTLTTKLETQPSDGQATPQMIAVLSTSLDEINQKLAGNLSVTVNNPSIATAVSNFPEDSPISSIERGQEAIGGESFNKSEEFQSWALRKGYAKIAFSGEINNPKNGAEVEALKLTIPPGHTCYVSKISLASTSARNTNFKFYYKPNGDTESSISKEIVPSTDSKSIDFDKKLKSGDEFRLVLEPVSSASNTSTVTIYYYDLPWLE